MRFALPTFVLCATLAACGPGSPSVVVHPQQSPPERLSDWGVVLADGRHFELNVAVFPYELNMPLFSDYALKLRTVWLPAGTTVGYTEAGELDVPVGTIISKTFHYEKAAGFSADAYRVVRNDRESTLNERGKLDLDRHVLIETRLLVRYDDGWQALPYVWNTTQDEAWLEIAGDVREIELVDGNTFEKISYIVPDSNQCAGCHAVDHGSKALRPIGPKAWQLNRPYDDGTQTSNQLERWASAGLLTGLAESPPAGARWSEPAGTTLARRASDYLDVNCAHCHSGRGSADTSGLQLRRETAVDRQYGICKPPVAVGRGSGNRPYDIYPGRPDESIMVYRMQHSDPAIAMPELGRSTVHREGVELISEWIAALPGAC